MNLSGLDISILAPAFVAGILVLATHVPLGQEVLRRGIIFIDLAIAQIAGLGVIAANYFGSEAHGWEVQITAITSALLGAWLFSWIEKHWGSHQEALIGVTFILAASASLLLLANNPQGGEHLTELLVGQILWVTWEQLVPLFLISLVILLLWFRFRHHLGHAGFYLLFALAITSSVQLVGVYLVFASLIIPALGSVGLIAGRGLKTAYAIGLMGYILGLVLSAVLDLPSGAVIVWCIAVMAIITRILIKSTWQGSN